MGRNILVGIDLDGTLLTPDKKITRETLEVLEQAYTVGITIVPITGRPVSGLPEELFNISGIEYAITNNGAVTYHIPEKKIIDAQQMTKEKSIEIYDTISSYATILEAFIDGYGYENQHSYNHLIERYKENIILDYIRKSRKDVPDLREYLMQTDGFIDEISIMCKGKSECKNIKKLLSRVTEINVIEAAKNELEVYSLRAGKGNALIRLGERMGIHRNCLVAIGDGNNDIDMFQKVGCSIAMGNSTPQLKQYASYITLNNSQDGVAWAIKKYILKEEQ